MDLINQPRTARNDSTPVRVQTNESNVNSRRGAASGIYEDFVLDSADKTSFIVLIRSIISEELASLKGDFKTSMYPIQEELKTFKKEFEIIKVSLDFINSKFDEINKRIECCEGEMNVLTQKCMDIGKLCSSVEEIEFNNNNREQWARKSNVEVYGIPERKNENLISLLQTVFDKTHLQFNINTDIDFITRVASKKNDVKKSKPIIVRFICRWKKDEFLSAVRKLKLKCCDIGFNGNNNSIFFNDHLTSLNKALLQSVKKAAKDKGYEFVWVKNCSIMARRSNTSPVLHFVKSSDLKKIV
ncbi:unnamed protein product [Danaus chrysippus]|uniref:(African queen) hypothetical protein n=1 Tax=Danaus chrysippus TaxID=151541 RepID=A0A8J2R1T2_9NEOP|nr:unnamed protein product [Danaus chrysippus]